MNTSKYIGYLSYEMHYSRILTLADIDLVGQVLVDSRHSSSHTVRMSRRVDHLALTYFKLSNTYHIMKFLCLLEIMIIACSYGACKFSSLADGIQIFLVFGIGFVGMFMAPAIMKHRDTIDWYRARSIEYLRLERLRMSESVVK